MEGLDLKNMRRYAGKVFVSRACYAGMPGRVAVWNDAEQRLVDAGEFPGFKAGETSEVRDISDVLARAGLNPAKAMNGSPVFRNVSDLEHVTNDSDWWGTMQEDVEVVLPRYAWHRLDMYLQVAVPDIKARIAELEAEKDCGDELMQLRETERAIGMLFSVFETGDY